MLYGVLGRLNKALRSMVVNLHVDPSQEIPQVDGIFSSLSSSRSLSNQIFISSILIF